VIIECLFVITDTLDRVLMETSLPRFAPIRFIVDKMALGQAFYKSFGFLLYARPRSNGNQLTAVCAREICRGRGFSTSHSGFFCHHFTAVPYSLMYRLGAGLRIRLIPSSTEI
jgi:hypothetical protein